MSKLPKPVRVPDLIEKKRRGQKISMLTAYDSTMARLLDQAGIDAILVGDSLGMVVLGYETTLPVTLDAMVHHTQAVSRGAKRPLIVADLPFLTYQTGIPDAVRNAGRLLQEGGAAAIKLEGGRPVVDVVARLVDIGIPVMGHLGLIPQSVHQLGGFRRVGKSPLEAEQIFEDARALQKAGAFAVVLESIPEAAAQAITAELAIPTIGIGAGPHCDGQVLVSYDVFGLYQDFTPPFVKRYANLGESIRSATREYIADIESGDFPPHQKSSNK
jgi:3-methyl-2-oxobutanoate hydroxymethyltransferase